MNTRTFRLILITFFLVPLAVWVATPSPASAHALLVKTVPSSGSLVDTAPTEIQLFLSESVSLDFSTVQLYDHTRKEIATGALATVNGDQNSILAPISTQLPPDTYTVVWRALSSTDGHLSAGSFAFRIKGATDTAAPIEPIDLGTTPPTDTGFDNTDPLRWLLRALSLALAVLLLGGAIFTVLVIEPAAQDITPTEPEARIAPAASRRFAMIGTISGLLLAVLLLADLAAQVSAVNGSSFFGAFSRTDSALLIVQTTRYGLAWLLKVVGTLVLTALMLIAWQVRQRNTSWVWEIALAAASLFFLAEALGSHGAAVSEAGTAGNLPIPIISYWLHLITAGIWMGGVSYMGLALFPAFTKTGLSREERRTFLGRTIPRFTQLAIASVIVLGITGTYNLVIHSVDLGAILGSAYGQLLVVKITAYIALVVIGAVNVRRITPLLKAKLSGQSAASTTTGPAAGLGRNVRIEMVLGAVALICAGGMTLLPPPTNAVGLALDESQSPIEVAPASTLPSAVAGYNIAGYTFVLTTTPSLNGDHLLLDLERTGTATPLTDVAKVLFKITPQDVDAGSTSYQADPVGTSGPNQQSWQTTQSFLTLQGSYIVTVIVQRTQSDDVKAAFRLNLLPDGSLSSLPTDVVDLLIATNPFQPISGAVVLTITLLDGAHKPIEGAKVAVSPSMPARPNPQPSVIAQPVAGQPGIYSTPVQLNAAGSWLLTFTIEQPGEKPIKTDASLDVAATNPTPSP